MNNNKWLCTDIETGPLANAGEFFNPDSVKLGNFKDPEKIEAKIEEARAAFIDKAALSPMTGEILAVGFYEPGDEDSPFIFHREDKSNLPGGEKGVICVALDHIGGHLMAQRPVVGWNCIKFDFPFLYKRAMIHGLEFPAHIWDLQKGYAHSKIVDLMRRWNMGDRQELTALDKVSRVLGGPGKPAGVSGADFARLYKAGGADREVALEYLENDLLMTNYVAERLL